jgi:hypothetical protein
MGKANNESQSTSSTCSITAISAPHPPTDKDQWQSAETDSSATHQPDYIFEGEERGDDARDVWSVTSSHLCDQSA